VHYTNYDNDRGAIDRSTVRLLYTTQPRLNNIGSLVIERISYDRSGKWAIPPNKKRWFVTRSCTVTGLGAGNSVSLYQTSFHGHLLGNEMYMDMWKQGQMDRKVLLSHEHYWHFDDQTVTNQQARKLTIEDGDTFVGSCVYNSVGRKDPTDMGIETTDEMCWMSVNYFPAADVHCKTGETWSGELKDGEDFTDILHFAPHPTLKGPDAESEVCHADVVKHFLDGADVINVLETNCLHNRGPTSECARVVKAIRMCSKPGVKGTEALSDRLKKDLTKVADDLDEILNSKKGVVPAAPSDWVMIKDQATMQREADKAAAAEAAAAAAASSSGGGVSTAVIGVSVGAAVLVVIIAGGGFFYFRQMAPEQEEAPVEMLQIEVEDAGFGMKVSQFLGISQPPPGKMVKGTVVHTTGDSKMAAGDRGCGPFSGCGRTPTEPPK